MGRGLKGLDELMRGRVKGEGIERRAISVRGAKERGNTGAEDILSVSGEEDGVSRGGGSALFGADDFRRKSTGRFGGIPGVAQIFLSCFRTYIPPVV
jgi:hypothetical protein